MYNNRYRYLFIFILAVITLTITELCKVYYYFNINVSWYYAFLTNFGITLFIWEGSRIIEPVISKISRPAENKIQYLAIYFIVGNIVNLVSVSTMVYAIGHMVYHLSWNGLHNPLKLNFIYGFLINLLFQLINAILLFFTEYKRQWMEAEELKRISSQAQIQLIKSQIKPHFLFNNLNVLSGMVIKDNPDANRFIEAFSKVYRYILNNHEKELIELYKELEFIEPYLFLLEKRFNEGLKITMSIPSHYKNSFIVPASLQMLIENAIKHNIVSRNKPLFIDIHANGNETLIVKNNLQQRTVVESSTRIGLENIHKRYEMICGRNVVINKNETSFEVVLPLLKINIAS